MVSIESQGCIPFWQHSQPTSPRIPGADEDTPNYARYAYQKVDQRRRPFAYRERHRLEVVLEEYACSKRIAKGQQFGQVYW